MESRAIGADADLTLSQAEVAESCDRELDGVAVFPGNDQLYAASLRDG